MAHLATLSDYKFENAAEDVRGANLYGENDEKLGTIDDVILDHGNGGIRYVVIDSNGWLPGGQYLIPAHRIQPYHKHENDFYADLDKERIKMFPPYDKKALESEESWRNYEDRYEAVWTEDPVEHRAGSTHNITPPPGEMTSSGGGRIPESEVEREPSRIAREDNIGIVERNAGGQITESTPAGIHYGAADVTYEPGRQVSRPIDLGENRWSRFQQSVRRDRERIAGTCGICGRGSRRVA